MDFLRVQYIKVFWVLLGANESLLTNEGVTWHKASLIVYPSTPAVYNRKPLTTSLCNLGQISVASIPSFRIEYFDLNYRVKASTWIHLWGISGGARHPHGAFPKRQASSEERIIVKWKSDACQLSFIRFWRNLF